MIENTTSGARRQRGALTMLLGAAALSACSLASQTPEMRYYTLAVTAAPSAPLPAPLRVGAFSVDEPYASARLAYRTSPYLLEYYTYHRWAAEPRLMVPIATRDYVERAAVTGTGAPLDLTGHVRRVEEVDGASGWSAALALDLRIARGGAAVLERSYAETEPAASRSPEAVVAALSRALHRILDRALADIPSDAWVSPSAHPAGR